MWYLDNEDKSIRAKCSVAPVVALDFITTYIDQTSANLNYGPISNSGTINSVAADIVAPPIDKVRRAVESISVVNTDGVQQIVTISFFNSVPFPGVSYVLITATLEVGWKLEFNEEGNWNIYDESGLKKNDNIIVSGDVNIVGWFGSVLPTVGQKTMVNSIPVVLSSDQTTINITQVSKNTYRASVLNLVVANNPTDIFTIIGSATKKVCVTKFAISGTKQQDDIIDLVVLKRSTANTGGTSTVMTNVPNDSTNPAATAVVRAYTANPTLGTLVGNVTTEKFDIQNTGKFAFKILYLFGVGDLQPECLNGIAELLAFNFNATATTMNQNKFDAYVEWTET